MAELFTQSLHSIYTDIYILSTMGFSSMYVESMTALERSIFKLYNKIEQTVDTDTKNEDTLTEMGLSPDMLL